MQWLIWLIISTFLNTFVIITVVDIILMGRPIPYFAGKCSVARFMIDKENRIDIQKGNECSGYSTAYILRHYSINVNGLELYNKMPNKMANGCVYPKEVKRTLEEYGFSAKYCVGNLNALKKEVCRGNPVIVFIKVRKDKKWLHYVPVVGYDENNIFMAESLADYINCNEKGYNRKISKKDFLALWNTTMLKMPLYTRTFFVVKKNRATNPNRYV